MTVGLFALFCVANRILRSVEAKGAAVDGKGLVLVPESWSGLRFINVNKPMPRSEATRWKKEELSRCILVMDCE